MYRRNDLSRMRRVTPAVVALAVLAPATARADEGYLERRDTITLGAHDAVQSNKAVQTINRWPKAAWRDRWVWDGERARSAVDRYRRRGVPNPKTLDDSPFSATQDNTKPEAAQK